MSVRVLPDDGPVLVLADLHADDYVADGEDIFASNGLNPLLDQRYAAVIIAGDLVSNARLRLGPALRDLVQRFAPAQVFFFPGNHDFYGAGIDEEDRLQQITEAAGAIYAQKLELIQGGTRFLMATLWTDFALNGDPDWAMTTAEAWMMDHSHISMPGSWATDLSSAPRRRLSARALRRIHGEHRAWIAERLAEPFAGRSVVVTHHAPHPRVMGRITGLSPAFGSDLSELIATGAPDLWLFGHTHRRHWERIGATIIRNVSVGYPGELSDEAHPAFLTGCVVGPDSFGNQG